MHCFLRLSWLERGLPDRRPYYLAHLPRSRYFLYRVDRRRPRNPSQKAASGKAGRQSLQHATALAFKQARRHY
ncbi:Uncharacterised protein [Chromobacterium violaceum]|uniref:Uncharacterized protein n=1 Tax=Chromobacterium violaceum TaxID=536 RepID=A0A3S4IH06_CHRVL|nr:Uncharacterised protein [Chromobacterium violaceum]